jgi:excinuclease ABC subunit C
LETSNGMITRKKIQAEEYKNLPAEPGVYLMRDAEGRLLYVGKAGSLKRRVASYFERPHELRIQKLVSEIAFIEYEITPSALEALILESHLIKTLQPPYNILDKDDKSYLWIEITGEEFPRVLLVRGTAPQGVKSKRFGPFVSGSSARVAYGLIRKIFPFNIHRSDEIGKMTRPCFDHQLGLCPGTCIGAVSKEDYASTVKHVTQFLGGKKRQIVRELKKEMAEASKELEFEKAGKLKRQIFALEHIKDTALIDTNELPPSDSRTYRIEGYDISHISGTSAVGSMVVFMGNEPDKNEYRKFRIRTITQADDTGMLKEVLRRRLNHSGWPLPGLFLIDGGVGQVNAVTEVLESFGMKIPVVGIAKGPKRKKNEFIGLSAGRQGIPPGFNPKTLIKVRDEAHRFAVSYHRKLRSKI